MTEQEREELIEKITQNIVVACGYRMTPTRWLIVQSHARAALAVAEPVIREQCAEIALKERVPILKDGPVICVNYNKACEDIASAIREGWNE